MKQVLKKIASRLSHRTQQALKRRYFASQIRHNRFVTHEPEFGLLSSMIKNGDWVIDVGANIGHYTLQLSRLVNVDGRVIAFEPVPETFELLTSNSSLATFQNITLVNAAVSSSARLSGIKIPKFTDTGLEDCYEAELTAENSGLQVLCLSLDSLNIPNTVRLVKIDVEGHELAALQGMRNLLQRDRPLLIVENNDAEVPKFLTALGYRSERIDSSSNLVFRHEGENL